MERIVIAAPQFVQAGGWVLDTQFVPNLFMVGRCISVSHDALGTARVMRTGGMMGAVIGKYCVRYNCDPRGVYEQHMDERMTELKAIPHGKKNRLVSNQG